MNLKKGTDFPEDVIKVPCLMTGCSGVGVAVHGITAPDHLEAFLFHLPCQLRQVLINLVSSKTGYQGHTAWLILRIQLLKNLLDLIDVMVGAHLHANGVQHAPEKF